MCCLLECQGEMFLEIPAKILHAWNASLSSSSGQASPGRQSMVTYAHTHTHTLSLSLSLSLSLNLVLTFSMRLETLVCRSWLESSMWWMRLRAVVAYFPSYPRMTCCKRATETVRGPHNLPTMQSSSRSRGNTWYFHTSSLRNVTTWSGIERQTFQANTHTVPD